MLDDHLIVRVAGNDSFDLGQLMAGSDKELLGLGSDCFVVGHCQRQEKVAVKVRAFAEELVDMPIKSAVRRGDLLNPLVDLPEDGLVSC